MSSGPFGFPSVGAVEQFTDDALAAEDEGFEPDDGASEPEAPETAAPAESPPAEALAPPAGPGEEGYRWAAKYEDPQQLEQGYRELNARYTQLTQSQAERDRAAAQRINELEIGLQNALPYIQAGMAAQQGVGPGGTPTLRPEEVDFDDPEQLNTFLEAKIAERMQPILNQMQQQSQAQQYQTAQQQYMGAAEQAITSFRTDHPDVAGTAVEDEMANIIQQFGLDLRDREQIDFAYSIWQNPAVGDAVRASPVRATSPQGRREALMLAPQFAAPVNGGPAPTAGRGVKRARPVAAYVETGGTGAPVAGAPGERREKDAFDEVLDLLDNSKPSVFGLRVAKR
jgi:type II secretory pathway pseudopilin PulG